MNSQTNLEKLQNILRQIFQFDSADLDFGVYRILNLKREQIENFLKKDLPKAVSAELEKGALAEQSLAAKELKEVIKQVKDNLGEDAIDPDGNLAESFHKVKIGKRYLELREKAVGASSREALEALIFNHLYTFFNRYYDNGDFMSKRRYSKREKYAVPYNGEEVYLHWANSDQYYVKTGEYFTEYSFISTGIKIHFKLQNVDVEQDNKKGNTRFFIPITKEASFDAKEKLILIPFEYRPLTKQEDIKFGKTNLQDSIIADALEAIPKHFKKEKEALAALLADRHKSANGKLVNHLEHHLRRYTRRNTYDFFIHKDLKGFLEKELDFYIKNEVLNVDELEALGKGHAESWFQIMRTIKVISRTIIALLAQIENFQKMLWLKKKFVVDTNYCMTLDWVPEEFYPEIAKNDAQRDEWVRLFAINEVEKDLTGAVDYSEPLTVEFLKANPFLVLDTTFFSREFKDRLLASLDDIDGKCNGLLVQGENFQALNILKETYLDSVQCIYIDPPYNTDASAILYKNDYKDSSWLTLMENRLRLAHSLIKPKGIICVAIDDEEVAALRFVLSRVFKKEIGIVAVRSNPAGRKTKGRLAPAHEYALFFGKTDDAIPASLPKTEKSLARFPKEDERGRFAWANFIRSGTNDRREDRPKLYYPIFVHINNTIRIPKMKWDAQALEYILLENPTKEEVAVYPIGMKGGKMIEKNWQRGHHRVANELKEFRVRRKADGEISIDFKTRMDEGSLPTTWWDNKLYASANYGAAELKDLFGEKTFDFSKSKRLVEDCLRTSNLRYISNVVLDFFAGSGTTAHATIELNRDDKGNRKYLMAEIGDCFYTVLKPRIKKVVYSKDWKEGKPASRNGISQMFKYISLESYEDALNNISFRLPKGQKTLKFDDYLINYMLTFETKESETFLNVEKLASPFSYKLVLTEDQEKKETPVDLPETFNYLLGLHVKTRKAYNTRTYNIWSTGERSTAGRSRSYGEIPKTGARRTWRGTRNS